MAPYSNIKTVLSLATTGHYRRSDGELIATGRLLLSYVIARSLVAALPRGGQATLSGELKRVGRESPDPPPPQLAPDGRPRPGVGASLGCSRTVIRTLRLRSTQIFRDVRHDSKSSRRSPHGKDTRPVELAHGPATNTPSSQSYALERVAPQRRGDGKEALDHAKLEVSLGDIPAFATFDAFVVRSLRMARVAD